jgi:hypothetical protein
MNPVFVICKRESYWDNETEQWVNDLQSAERYTEEKAQLVLKNSPGWARFLGVHFDQSAYQILEIEQAWKIKK